MTFVGPREWLWTDTACSYRNCPQPERTHTHMVVNPDRPYTIVVFWDQDPVMKPCGCIAGLGGAWLYQCAEHRPKVTFAVTG